LKGIAHRQGFGDVLAHGTSRAAAIIGGKAPALITDYMFSRSDQFTAYGPRMFITTGIFLAMEPRHPIQQLHEVSMPLLKWLDWQKGKPHAFVSSEVLRGIARRFWGSEIAADYSTYEGKALAAKLIQDRQYIKECLILCDFTWPILYVANSEDHVGDPSIESKIFSAITGVEVDEQELYRYGERVVNLQRAILAREGHRGRESDKLREVFFTTPMKTEFHNPECLAPGKDGEAINKRGWMVDRQKFEELKTDYYGYRGWDPATGLQTKAKLDELGMGDIAEGLDKYKAVV
ncbi:MAG: aldehyde ferredoxin oxidoreductase C-terminal domain-containing protein, partial [Dehalococcoidia bacterium]|nr:aldehyde ferredoxin oxidoreductase C-terminal domain-containing protein [Dehalococcoidia bacterium]